MILVLTPNTDCFLILLKELYITIGIGVGHMRDRIETEGTIETLVTVDQDQVQEQLHIGIGLDVSSVGNMTTLQETV